ncbi:MAG: hypothetical protein PHU06_02725 [Gallionella sp.]|nr:hypothetical protein [Gallionella sp.]MDD4958266.1 hypothetical protein [Gallionella sp.]
MEHIAANLAQAFCEDCRARNVRIAEIVQAGTPLTDEQLVQLYQEYDTLFGGAIAVRVRSEQEEYFRSMARYLRYLHNQQQAGQPVDFQDWQWLLSGIKMGWCCDDELPNGFDHGTSEALVLLKSRINKVSERKEK